MRCKWVLPCSREWNLGHWGLTGGSLKGSQNLSVAVGLVLLGGSAPAAFAALCCLLLHTADNRPMILSCSQETAVSSGTWPPSRSPLGDGSSCLLLKPDSEGTWVSTGLTQPSAALTCVNQPLCLPVWLFSMGCFWGAVLGRCLTLLPLAAHTPHPLKNIPLCCSALKRSSMTEEITASKTAKNNPELIKL